MTKFLKPSFKKLISTAMLFGFLVLFFLPVEKSCSGFCVPGTYEELTPIYKFKPYEEFGSPQFEQTAVTARVDYLYLMVYLVFAYLISSGAVTTYIKIRQKRSGEFNLTK